MMSSDGVRVFLSLVAVALLVWPSLLVTAASLLFLLGQPAGLNPIYALLMATLGVAWLLAELCRKRFPCGANRAMLLCLIVWLGATLSSFLIAGKFLDISGDGQWYHQEAVIRLSEGWNPIYEDLTDQGFEDRGASEFVEGYPHGLWLLQSIIYRLTTDIELAKGWNLVFAAAAGLLSLLALDVLRLGWWRFPIAVAVTANPITISQSMSFYNDTVIGSLSTCLISLAVILWRAPSLEMWIVYVAALILYINTKFLGLAYGIVFVTTVLVLQVFYKIDWRETRLFLSVSAAAGVIGTLLIGLHPYVTNLFRHGEIMYPIRGSNLFAQWRGPASVLEYGRLGALLWSVYGEPAVTMRTESTVQVKRPFAVTQRQLQQYRYWPDLHIGGFGIYFSEAFTVGLVLLGIFALSAWRCDRKLLLCLLAVLAATLTSVLLKPFTWWARYHAHFYLFPVMICVAVLLAISRGSVPRWTAALVALLCSLLLANSALLCFVYFDGQREYTEFVKERLHQLSTLSRSAPVVVYFQHLRANRQRWRDFGIAYREVRRKEELPCSQPETIWMSHLFYCVEPAITAR